MYVRNQHPFQGDSFQEQLIDQIRRTPWMLISGAVHALIFVVLSLFVTPEVVPEDVELAGVTLDEPFDDEEIIEEPPTEPETEPIEEDITPLEEVEFVEEVPQDDAEKDLESFEGESMDAVSDALDSLSNSTDIGLGANAGGDFGTRNGGGRGPGGRRGPRLTEVAVDRGLAWLARHQAPDGSWDGDGFSCKDHGTCDCRTASAGSAVHDVGLTGLALLCFLGAGETHKSGTYRKNVKNGLRWLRSRQDAEGCFGARSTPHFTYDHAIATLAMAEAYGMTRSPILRNHAARGVGFVQQLQNYGSAWRYGEADGDNDVSVTGWMVMALKAGRSAGLPVDERHMKWALAYIDEMTDDETGRTGYIKRGEPPVREEGMRERFPSEESESLTAVAIASRIFCGEDPAESAMIRLGSETVLSRKLPVWDTARGSIDMYYWYYGSLAMFQVGGEPWRKWNRAMVGAVVDSQREDGDFSGSWDPAGAWGETGGRIYSTAMMTLCLEVYYRYGRVFGTK